MKTIENTSKVCLDFKVTVHKSGKSIFISIFRNTFSY